MTEFYELIINGDATVLKDRNGNIGVAKRDPDDKYNLCVGIYYAMRRLKGELPKFNRHHEPRKPKEKDGDLFIAINDFTIDEPDWNEVPMGTPVMVRDSYDGEWTKALFIKISKKDAVRRTYPYLVIRQGAEDTAYYKQIKLDHGDDKQ